MDHQGLHLKCFFVSLTFLGLFNNNIEACEQTIRISAYNNWQPYSYKQGSTYKGLDIEILELILRKINICSEYINYPSSSRALKEFKKGNVDLIFAASFTPARQEFANFSLAYREERMQLFEHASNIYLATIDYNPIVAVDRGSVYGPKFEKLKSNCMHCIVETNLAKERFGLVKKERVDYAIEDILSGTYLIMNHEFKGFVKPTNITIHKNPTYFMLRPSALSNKQFEKFNLAIKRSQREIKALCKNYYSKLGLLFLLSKN